MIGPVASDISRKLRQLGGAVALGCVAALPVSAEEVILKCYFDWGCDPNRKCDHADLDIRFRANMETNTVEPVGRKGLSEYELIFGDRAITVLERPISGGVNSLTFLITGGHAVYSRNHIAGIDLEPAQYLGECVPL